MSTKTIIDTELNRLAPLLASGKAPVRMTLDVGDGRLVVDLDNVDQLGCAFERFAYETDKLASSSIDELKQLAETLSARLTYLLEKITPVEIYQQECMVQMRSNPPHKDDDGTKYYELVVRRGELGLCRYAKVKGQPRDVVPAHVTREVLIRLANDFIAAVA